MLCVYDILTQNYIIKQTTFFPVNSIVLNLNCPIKLSQTVLMHPNLMCVIFRVQLLNT